MKKTIKVVAAIIENEKKEILCALRSHNMSIPNKWEFPGGKLEVNENIYEALEREIYEELNCKVEVREVVHEHTHEYELFFVHLICMYARIIDGVPEPKEHAKIIWLPKDQLNSLTWAPADIPAVNKLILQKEN